MPREDRNKVPCNQGSSRYLSIAWGMYGQTWFSAHIKLSYTPMLKDLPRAQSVSLLFKIFNICLLTDYIIPTISLKTISVQCILSFHDEKHFHSMVTTKSLIFLRVLVVYTFNTYLIISMCSFYCPSPFIHICQVSLTRL